MYSAWYLVYIALYLVCLIAVKVMKIVSAQRRGIPEDNESWNAPDQEQRFESTPHVTPGTHRTRAAHDKQPTRGTQVAVTD